MSQGNCRLKNKGQPPGYIAEERVDGKLRLGISSAWQQSPRFVPTRVLSHIPESSGSQRANGMLKHQGMRL